MTSRLVIVAAIFLFLISGVTGPFMLDDFPNILHNPAVLWGEFSFANVVNAIASSPSGIINRPLPVLSFGITYWLFGIDATAFKLINFVIHIANALLVYSLVKHLCRLLPEKLRQQNLAFWIALIWALHPLQISSVFYVVQRMTLMSSFFMLLIMNVYLLALLKPDANHKKYLQGLGWVLVLLVLGFLCKENIVLAIPLIWLLDRAFRTGGQVRQSNLIGHVFFSVFLYLPACLIVIYSFVSPEWFLVDYSKRDFDLVERLFSQVIIVKNYWVWSIWPDISQLGLFHDDFVIVRSMSWALWLTLFFHVALLIVSLVLWKRSVFFSVSILFFYTNHLLESTLIPLELIFEHRNYLALLGPVSIVVVAVSSLLTKMQNIRLRPIVMFVLVLCFALPASLRAYQWGTPGLWVQMEVENHPKSVRARHAFLVQLFHNSVENGISLKTEQLINVHLNKVLQLDQNHLASLVMIIKLRSVLEKEQRDQDLQLLYGRLSKANANLELHKSHFQDLLQCQLDGYCKFKPQVLEKSYAAIGSNPNYSDEFRADLMATWAVYVGQAYKFDSQIEALLLQANAVAKTPYVYESLAQYYLLSGSLGKVNQLLSEWPQSRGSWIARRRVKGWLKNYSENKK
ncbi:hypothetical protein [Pelagibaculum spongiae]|uniref:Glycosyltransferase RgtA/B/C/D-like domain-containing protein n=1 Tax=Pelagibaculum spongiae TaxID=2080658 RepID=A0A2V1H506_9GAMM|nr:hypothetical protein [Pelagibaculum spongiae]PVZ71855.1 hypothetical protein DC094_02180 [Pelagibaculum spongiae]